MENNKNKTEIQPSKSNICVMTGLNFFNDLTPGDSRTVKLSDAEVRLELETRKENLEKFECVVQQASEGNPDESPLKPLKDNREFPED